MPTFYSSVAEIEHSYKCDGLFEDKNEGGKKYNKTVQLLSNKTLYVSWNTGGTFDGVREDWKEG